MSFSIGKGITLREYLALCLEDEENGKWMISEGIDYSLDMLIFPVELEDWDIDCDEYDEIEDKVLSHGNGYGNVLNVDQLVDIVNVLKQQKPEYTEKELEASLNYYSEYDAFLEL
ncbi:hypothetical protein KW437_18185 [Vibrio fluvialis]|nr:hypothetical protein [Vibrio fluvialis]